MNSYEQSARSRYWREAAQSAFQSVFPPNLPHHVAQAGSGLIAFFGLIAIFVVTVVALWLMRDSEAVFWVFVFGCICASPFLRAYKRAGVIPPPIPPSPPGATAQSQPTSGEIDRLLTALEMLEKRLTNLEAVITQKEFDWERRLNQEPPASSSRAGSTNPPV
jgi:hypothetical protein